jgi:hypothetical protein
VIALFLSVAPSFVSELMGSRSALLGACVAFAMLGASSLTQLLGRRLSLKKKVRVGLLSMGAGMCGFLLALKTASPWLIFMTIVIGGVGQGLSFLGGVEILEARADPRVHGQMISLLYAASYAGGSIPIICLGLLANTVGLGWAMSGYVLATLLLSLALLWMVSRSTASLERAASLTTP